VVNGLAPAAESPPGPLLRGSGRSGGPLHVGERGRRREAAAAERQRQWEEANPNVPKWHVQGAQP
jgi:hypothetical protein